MNKTQQKKIYQQAIDILVNEYKDDFQIKSKYDGIYVSESGVEFNIGLPQEIGDKYLDDFHILEDGFQEYIFQTSNLIMDFSFEDSRLSGSSSIYEIKSKEEGSLIILDHGEYANAIIAVKEKDCENIAQKIAKMYCFYEHESLGTYLETVPSFIDIGFVCSHKFIVWILYSLFDKENLWYDLERKYPNVYDLNYEFPKINNLIDSIDIGRTKKWTLDKRNIDQSKYDYLEKNFSFNSKNLSFNDVEENLSSSDRAVKEKALLRYLKQVLK